MTDSQLHSIHSRARRSYHRSSSSILCKQSIRWSIDYIRRSWKEEKFICPDKEKPYVLLYFMRGLEHTFILTFRFILSIHHKEIIGKSFPHCFWTSDEIVFLLIFAVKFVKFSCWYSNWRIFFNWKYKKNNISMLCFI